jgi:hypothetical protein
VGGISGTMGVRCRGEDSVLLGVMDGCLREVAE